MMMPYDLGVAPKSLILSGKKTARPPKITMTSWKITIFNRRYIFIHAWNAKRPIFSGNFTPKTSNYCLKNRALGFPADCYFHCHISFRRCI